MHIKNENKVLHNDRNNVSMVMVQLYLIIQIYQSKEDIVAITFSAERFTSGVLIAMDLSSLELSQVESHSRSRKFESPE
jgi:hypothetical protein